EGQNSARRMAGPLLPFRPARPWSSEGMPSEGKDRTLGPCYSVLIGLSRTGGADENLPSTARIRRCARRRGGVAACSAPAAAERADHWSAYGASACSCQQRVVIRRIGNET